jgi:signal transduction histidine kinase
MALELAEVAAGLPFAASFAVAGGIATLREGRRRAALNEAMHELRRPLQVLSLSMPAESRAAETLESSLRMATAALAQLDREINGVTLARSQAPVPFRPLLEAAVGRWHTRTVLIGGSLRVRWSVGDAVVYGDEVELSQAVDNLISNAIEHGGGELKIDVCEDEGCLVLRIVDSGGATDSASRRVRTDLRRRIGGRLRHGHGLRVVERVAVAHGGSFRLRRSSKGAEARLELPLHGRGESR